MPYTNTIVTTSTSGTWNGTSFSYNSISLIAGIPHSAQLEVERVFTVPRSTSDYATIEDFLNNSATTQKDKQQVFIIPASRITFDETNKTITAIDLPSTGNTYDFNPDGIGLANVPVPAIAVSDTLKIRRKTVSNETLVEWSAGSKLTSAQLNLEVKQLLYLIQELIDKTTTEVTVSNTAIGTIPNYSILPVKLSVGGPIWNSSSYLGIGMTPTTRTLSVYQAANPTIQIVNSTTGSLAGDGGIIYMSGSDMLVTNQESANLKLETSNTTRLTITSSGDVGIGTTTPTTKLTVAGTTSITGITTITSSQASTSTSSGALQVTGGVGVGGTVYAGGFNGPLTGNVTGNLTGTVLTAAQTSITSLGTLSSLAIGGTLSATGITSITNATASTSTSTGALKVSGGVGIVGDVYAGSIQSTPIGATTRSSGAFTTLASNGATTMTAATASTSTTTGTLVVTGGVGVSGTVYAANLTTSGLLTASSDDAPVAGGANTTGIKMSNVSNLGIYFGSGAPSFSAAIGSLYVNTSAASTTTRLYICKTANTAASGSWTAFTSVS